MHTIEVTVTFIFDCLLHLQLVNTGRVDIGRENSRFSSGRRFRLTVNRGVHDLSLGRLLYVL